MLFKSRKSNVFAFALLGLSMTGIYLLSIQQTISIRRSIPFSNQIWPLYATSWLIIKYPFWKIVIDTISTTSEKKAPNPQRWRGKTIIYKKGWADFSINYKATDVLVLMGSVISVYSTVQVHCCIQIFKGTWWCCKEQNKETKKSEFSNKQWCRFSLCSLSLLIP